jgi:hypothetical protein
MTDRTCATCKHHVRIWTTRTPAYTAFQVYARVCGCAVDTDDDEQALRHDLSCKALERVNCPTWEAAECDE